MLEKAFIGKAGILYKEALETIVNAPRAADGTAIIDTNHIVAQDTETVRSILHRYGFDSELVGAITDQMFELHRMAEVKKRQEVPNVELDDAS